MKPGGEESSPIRSEISLVLDEYLVAWHAGDLVSWADLFTEDCDFVTWGGRWWASRSENLAGHSEAEGLIRSQGKSYELELLSSSEIAPSVVLAHVKWCWRQFVDAPGSTPEDRSGLLSMVFVRTGTAWKIRSAHNTRTE